MNHEPCLCVSDVRVIKVGYGPVRVRKPVVRRYIPRCEFGFLHDAEDWICPHHDKPKIAQKVQSRKKTAPYNTKPSKIKALIGATLRITEPRDGAQLKESIYRHSKASITRSSTLRALKNMQDQGLVEHRRPRSGTPIRLTESGKALFGG